MPHLYLLFYNDNRPDSHYILKCSFTTYLKEVIEKFIIIIMTNLTHFSIYNYYNIKKKKMDVFFKYFLRNYKLQKHLFNQKI
ncbi:MAG: hypothetical protein A2Z98_14060 [Spirochaetes bacterium GWB1_27_13]|nr:MAG: hypothetical protein A2Z98_14060 [Spirochaetes bacterium GWB1_27_13]